MNKVVNTTVISNFAAIGRLDLFFAALPLHLHPAERTCLSIARRRGWGFLSDDRTARQQAHDWNIPLSGTIGILLLAIRDGRLTIATGNTVLREMVERANYRSPTLDLGEILMPIGQMPEN